MTNLANGLSRLIVSSIFVTFTTETILGNVFNSIVLAATQGDDNNGWFDFQLTKSIDSPLNLQLTPLDVSFLKSGFAKTTFRYTERYPAEKKLTNFTSFNEPTPSTTVPETSSSLVLLGSAVMGLLVWRRRSF